MAGTVAFIGGASGTGSITNVSKTNPLPVDATFGGTVETSAVATAAAPSYIEGSADAMSMTLAGSLRVTNTTALAAGTNVIGHVLTDTGSTSIATGATAAGSSLTAAPVTTGGLAKTANPTAVTDGQVVNQLYDKLGKAIAVSAVRDLKGTQHTTITSSTAETTIVTAVASTFCDVYRMVISNSSASACVVTIKDSTAGTTRYVFAVAPGATVGFSGDAGSATPQATVNTNWTATCSASVASIDITCDFVKNT